jgi:hypothetical protein
MCPVRFVTYVSGRSLVAKPHRHSQCRDSLR